MDKRRTSAIRNGTHPMSHANDGLSTDTLIVGGGLSGLSLADRLLRAGRDVHIAEARDRFGGRILTETPGGLPVDMGPAWIWHGQPRIAALLDRFSLTPFEQYSTGDTVVEDARGGIVRHSGFSAMAGSLRVPGGLGTLVRHLVAELPANRVHGDKHLISLRREGDKLSAVFADGTSWTARRAVLALPPRLAAGAIEFTPRLPDDILSDMIAIPTWMAGHAKCIAVYDRPFWRDVGLSGDAMSRQGPMVEIHDASPFVGDRPTSSPGALFGFLGVPAWHRTDENHLKDACRRQFERLFGSEAAHPDQMVLKDWAADPCTATQADANPLMAHPRYGLPKSLSSIWNGSVILASTEVAAQHGGVLEGALEAAEHAAKLLLSETAVAS